MRYLLVDVTKGEYPEGLTGDVFDTEEEALYHAAEEPDRLEVVREVSR